MNLEAIKKRGASILLQFAIPCMIGMLLTAAITLVDGYFIGNYIGKEGTAAVNFGLPLTYLYLGIGIMVGVGGIALAGIAYGAGNIERCNQVFRQTIALTAMITFGLTAIVAIIFIPATGLLRMDAVTLKHFRNYYFIMIFVFPIMIINNNYSMFMRGEGKPQVGMSISILSLVLNVVLDAVTVRVFHFGITGVALSSLLSVVICFIVSTLFFVKSSAVYHFGTVKFVKEDVRNILLNGSSEFIGELSMSITMGAYNSIVLKCAGVDGVAAFAVVGYISYIFSMFIIGIGQGMSPLVSFTFGAKEIPTSKRLRSIATIYSIIAGGITFLVLLFGKDGYSHLFVKDPSVVTIVLSGITIFSISFLIEGINAIASFYFTSIGHAKESAVISAARGLVILLIALFILPKLFGMTGVWLVAPVTEGLTLLISFAYYAKERSLAV